jgi:predicted PilT family ATPase
LDKQQPNPSDDSKLTKYVIRVLIPSTAAGAVIGKGGSNVRQMAESSGCKMKVSDSSDPFGTKERIVTVMGPSPENVIKVVIFQSHYTVSVTLFLSYHRVFSL